MDIVYKLWDEICGNSLEKLREKEFNLGMICDLDQDVVALWRLEADMYNGGYTQFFSNWGIENAKKANRALNRIGATESEKICEELLAIFLSAADGAETYDDVLRAITTEQSASIMGIEQRFFEVGKGGEIARCAVTYFRARNEA